MPSKTRTYTQILLSIASEGSGDDFREKAKQFLQLLRRRGDFRLIGKILREFERRWEATKGKTATVVAREPLSGSVRIIIERELKNRGYALKEVVNPEVKDGMAVFLGKEYFIDGTVKGRL